MRRLPISLVAPSLMAALAVCPAVGRVARAEDAGPTAFQRAISSWMGVVSLLAAEGEGERKGPAEAREGRERSERGDRGDRGGRGPREWTRPGGPGAPPSGRAGERGPGSRGPGPRLHAPPPGVPPHVGRGMSGPGMRSGSSARLDEIVERLTRIERKLDAAPRMGNPWSPRPEAGSRPGFMGPGAGRGREMPEEMRREMEKRRDEMRKRMEEARAKAGEAGRGDRPQVPMAAVSPEVHERIKGMMEEARKRMAETQEKMEQARKRFQEMEERIKKLEAEVERLKSAK